MKQKIMFRAHNKRNTKTTRKKKGGEQKKVENLIIMKDISPSLEKQKIFQLK